MIVGGEASSTEKLRKENYIGAALAILFAIPFVMLVSNFAPLPNMIDEQSQLAELTFQVNGPLGFLWNVRSWDLLLVVILVAAAMVGVMNLFSREGIEK